jgi:hypothetical protein
MFWQADRQTDRQTEGKTDRTNGNLIDSSRVNIGPLPIRKQYNNIIKGSMSESRTAGSFFLSVL